MLSWGKMGRVCTNSPRAHTKSAWLLENPELSLENTQRSEWQWGARPAAVSPASPSAAGALRHPGTLVNPRTRVPLTVNAPGYQQLHWHLPYLWVFFFRVLPYHGLAIALQLSIKAWTVILYPIVIQLYRIVILPYIPISWLTALCWVALMGKNLYPTSTVNAYGEHAMSHHTELRKEQELVRETLAGISIFCICLDCNYVSE